MAGFYWADYYGHKNYLGCVFLPLHMKNLSFDGNKKECEHVCWMSYHNQLYFCTALISPLFTLRINEFSLSKLRAIISPVLSALLAMRSNLLCMLIQEMLMRDQKACHCPVSIMCGDKALLCVFSLFAFQFFYEFSAPRGGAMGRGSFWPLSW